MLFTSAIVIAFASGAVCWDYKIPKGQKNTALPPPPRQNFTGTKLVADAAHPYIAPGPTDQRGPCPGLNTLANHGYINRSGIVTPQEVITAVQDAYNLGPEISYLLAYGAFMVDGNPFTNLMSIGGKDSRVGQGPALPKNPLTFGGPNAGLNTHALFEGDASQTRSDYALGNNHAFNETLFQLVVSKANQYGNGYYNPDSAAEIRYARIQDSIARNPAFNFVSPRYTTAYAESAFSYLIFVDGRQTPKQLSLSAMRSFFDTNRFPDGFYRRNSELNGFDFVVEVAYLFAKHPDVKPGTTNGAGNFTVAKNDPGFSDVCYLTKDASIQIPSFVYPNTTGVLREIMRDNFKYFYSSMSDVCPPLAPFGN